ncbi:MAG: sodium:proton antiporter [Candidatus Alcyoniella australis]|nr:sodium:proton antiporter [Candidatus Alcyoniella australis]
MNLRLRFCIALLASLVVFTGAVALSQNEHPQAEQSQTPADPQAAPEAVAPTVVDQQQQPAQELEPIEDQGAVAESATHQTPAQESPLEIEQLRLMQAADHEAAAQQDLEHETEHGEQAVAHGLTIGKDLPLWTCIPFAGILLSIALFPLFAPRFWHEHYAKVSAFWAVVFAAPFLAGYGSHAVYAIIHIYLIDYIPFIILLWALYTVAGGMIVRGTLRGTPLLNLLLILIGTALASWVGTTGAAMLMIRPLLRANEKRRHKVHIIVFFIFLVANIGGSLTPLGDPPLFLGFLHRVPFFWTMNLIKPMAFVAVTLLAVFFAMDSYYFRKEDKSQLIDDEPHEPIKVEGLHNILFLIGIICAVLASGVYYDRLGDIALLTVNDSGHDVTLHMPWVNPLRDGTLVLMGLLSLWTTRKQLRTDNGFTWHAIQEVAYLFAGIFMTIIPALEILHAGENGAFAFLIRAVKQPVHYFWATGVLSSFLDNAPTYLTFFNTSLGSFYAGMPEAQSVPLLIANYPQYLLAISCGAVFMGANTYIGNAPNFMVKSIAEEAGIKMPSFFGYMFRYSIPILVTLFVLVTLIFF